MRKAIRLIIFTIPLIWGCGANSTETTTTPDLRPVKYITVGQNNISGQHIFTGLATPQQEAKLSFRVSGTINTIKVKIGERVRKGQILATIDATDYRVSLDQSLANVQNSSAQIESSKAQLANAKANFVAAESNYKRYEKLYEVNSISLSDFEQAKSNYLSAQASYNAAKTQVEASRATNKSSESAARSASNQLAYTRMKAPFSGIISAINIEPNEIVTQGSPVIEINSETNPDIVIGVPENIISEITPSDEVIVRFNSIHDMEFNGSVYEIGYNSTGSTYPVTIRLSENDTRIRPGMPASAEFSFMDHHSEPDALLVPPSAVGEDESGNFVFRIESKEGKSICKKQKITVGKLNDTGFEVTSGLTVGDNVASAGLNILRDGMQVRLYEKLQ